MVASTTAPLPNPVHVDGGRNMAIIGVLDPPGCDTDRSSSRGSQQAAVPGAAVALEPVWDGIPGGGGGPTSMN